MRFDSQHSAPDLGIRGIVPDYDPACYGRSKSPVLTPAIKQFQSVRENARTGDPGSVSLLSRTPIVPRGSSATSTQLPACELQELFFQIVPAGTKCPDATSAEWPPVPVTGYAPSCRGTCLTKQRRSLLQLHRRSVEPWTGVRYCSVTSPYLKGSVRYQSVTKF